MPGQCKMATLRNPPIDVFQSKNLDAPKSQPGLEKTCRQVKCRFFKTGFFIENVYVRG
jgi:hypothetical protein